MHGSLCMEKLYVGAWMHPHATMAYSHPKYIPMPKPALTIPPYTYFTCTFQHLLQIPTTSSLVSHQNISSQPHYYFIPQLFNNGQALSRRSSPCSPFAHCPRHSLPPRVWRELQRAASAATVPQPLPDAPEAAMPVRAFWQQYFWRKPAFSAVLPSAEADGQRVLMWWVEHDDEEADERRTRSAGNPRDDADGSELAKSMQHEAPPLWNGNAFVPVLES